MNEELEILEWCPLPKEGQAMPAHQVGAASERLLRSADLMKRRPYQEAVLNRLQEAGVLALLWRRQAGKTSLLADIALKKMMKRGGRLVTFASVSILCGREIVLKESQVFMRVWTALQNQAAAANLKLELLDRYSAHSLAPSPLPEQEFSFGTTQGATAGTRDVSPSSASLITSDDFAELFEAQRLEFRLYHSPAVFSRTQVIAPNPATARGWTGDVMLDEIGFIQDLRSVWEAMEPIVASDPDFRVIMATTPPADDAHFSFELLAPAGTSEFKANPAGHWYRTPAGILVHRCDIYDAAAAGVAIYDLETRQPLTPQEHFARAIDKDAWRRNYGLQFLPGGASAVSLNALAHAQQAGEGQSLCVLLDHGEDLEAGVQFLRAHLGGGPVGLGWDLATTEKQLSNPSALAVVERVGNLFPVRLLLVWKTADPEQAEAMVRRILQGVAERPEAGPARRLCIDATNERYFASTMRQHLGGEVLVELVVGSETVVPRGEKQSITRKALLGHELLNVLEDGRMPLPPGRYVKEDFRLVKKSKGSFEHDVSAQGMHGDTFDACKLAYRAVTAQAPGPCAFVV